MPIFFYLLGLYWINFAGGVDVVGKFKKRGGGWRVGGRRHSKHNEGGVAL